MEEVQLGVQQEVLYGRKAKANLHQGTFHERQAKMLRMHLQAETVAKKKRKEQLLWLESSAKLFKAWDVPLKWIFRNYSRDFVPSTVRTKDFDQLMKLQGGLSIQDWMIMNKDFKIVPWLVSKTESLAIFHYANTELGIEDTELGARVGTQVLSYPEFISALRGVAMGEGFRSLPRVPDRIVALCAFMRRQAYTMGGLKNKVLDRRMGNPKQWEAKGCPMTEYVYMIPRSLNLNQSLRISLEIVDLIVARAVAAHILTLCPISIEPSQPEREPEWEPPTTVAMDDEVLQRLTEKKKGVYVPKKKPPSKTGFGSGFSPLPQQRVKKRSKVRRRFGDKAIGNLPLRFVHAGKAAISIISELVDDCVDGTARHRLDELYDIQGTGVIAVLTAEHRREVKGRFVKMKHSSKRKVNLAPPNLSPKEHEKADSRRAREAALAAKREKQRERKRLERQKELQAQLKVLKAQRAEKQAEQEMEMKRKKDEEDRMREDARIAMIQQQEEAKAKIQKWKEEGGRPGKGPRKKTHIVSERKKRSPEEVEAFRRETAKRSAAVARQQRYERDEQKQEELQLKQTRKEQERMADAKRAEDFASNSQRQQARAEQEAERLRKGKEEAARLKAVRDAQMERERKIAEEQQKREAEAAKKKAQEDEERRQREEALERKRQEEIEEKKRQEELAQKKADEDAAAAAAVATAEGTGTDDAVETTPSSAAEEDTPPNDAVETTPSTAAEEDTPPDAAAAANDESSNSEPTIPSGSETATQEGTGASETGAASTESA
jgi:hypothetical protein